MSNPALHVLVWSFVIWTAYAQNDTATDSPPTEDCTAGFRYLNSDNTVNISKSCTNGECITKCCPENQIMMKAYADDNAICVNSSALIRNFSVTDPDNYSKVDIYGKNVKQSISKTKKKLTDFTITFSERFISSCAVDTYRYLPEDKNMFYITEDGQLYWRQYNYFDQWSPYPFGKFCVEQQLDKDEHGQLVSINPHVVYKVIFGTGTDSSNDHGKLSVYGMLVSCFFMLLVLLVYGLLKELQNLAGMMLMAYVATLIAAFFARAILFLANDNNMLDTSGCSAVGIIFLYFMLASFTWMNVMSFDIWWSMRGFRKLRESHRGVLVKFGWYSLYGWGAPLIHILFIIIEEHMDLTHWPNFVKSHIIVDPESCFFNESERQLYLNVPILLTTMANIVLFLLTAHNIWRIKAAVTQHSEKDSKSSDKEQFRYGIYLKLSVVMGISWILEVVSSLLYPKSNFWYITDAYNVLIGMFIFVVFVCKRKIFVLLCRRFSIENEYIGSSQQASYSMSTREGKKKMAASVTDSSECSELVTHKLK